MRWPRITLVELAVILAVVGVLVILRLPAVTPGDPPPRFPPPRRLSQPWPPQLSGQYDRSHPPVLERERIETLAILLDGRYLRRFVSRHGLTGVSGYATGTPSHLILHRGSPPNGARTFLAIRWGSRDYLVEEGELPRFLAAVKEGSEPRTRAAGSFYLRRGDWNKPAAGMPDIPEPWKSRTASQRVHE